MTGATTLVRIVRSRLWHFGRVLVMRRHRRRMAAALAALNNRMLKDVGVSRSETGNVVSNPSRCRTL